MDNNDTIVLFENTTATEFNHPTTGRFLGWNVTADPGYVLHEITHDTDVIDEETGLPTGEVILGYTRATISVGWNYDFENNPRQIYAVLESEIEDPDQIHGGGDEPEHEVASTEPDTEPEPITE